MENEQTQQSLENATQTDGVGSIADADKTVDAQPVSTAEAAETAQTADTGTPSDAAQSERSEMPSTAVAAVSADSADKRQSQAATRPSPRGSSASGRGGSPYEGNPLGTQPIIKLMLRFAVPAITSSLVTAAYNITDQIFIGQGVGMLGNAATNVAFPLTTLCMALTIMIGMGSSSNFNLRLGAGDKEGTAKIAGTAIVMLSIIGTLIGSLAFIFVEPLMRVFGAPDNVYPYAVTYTRIIALGLPFVSFSMGSSTLIRADGSPSYSMFCTISGAALNVILDPLFIFVFKWGIAGAAYATVSSQFLTFLLATRYLRRFKTVKLSQKLLRVRTDCLRAIIKLGTPSFLNHFMMMVVQITMNNTLKTYGASSIYGSDIPFAVVGVVAKVNIIVIAFTVGIAQGCQPIVGFNYGAKNYARVKKTYLSAALAVLCTSFVAFTMFQLFPRQIVSIFGSGSELYYQFASRYMRIYMMMVCLFGLQPLTANFFTSIGKAYKGLFITMTRQGLFLLPLLLILPRYLGLDGIVYAGPIADSSAIILSVIFASFELRNITRLEQEQQYAKQAVAVPAAHDLNT